MVLKRRDDDGYVMGPLTGEEAAILLRALDDQIGEATVEQRNNALRVMLRKHGRSPCKVVEIGRQVLPHRNPRSVYNFVRRRVVRYTTGRWSAEEVFALLDHFFTVESSNPEQPQTFKPSEWPFPDGMPNFDPYGQGHDDSQLAIATTAGSSVSSNGSKSQRVKRDWKPVSLRINRLPEQIHDKWKEMRPIVHLFREIFEDPMLTQEERLRRVSFVLENCKNTRIPKKNSPAGEFSVLRSRLDRDKKEKQRCSNPGLWREIHNYIAVLTRESNSGGSVVSNIPWKKVSDRFKHFSESNIRLQWTLVIYPDVLARHVPGFTSQCVARCAIYHLRKHRVSVERLSHVDFSLWIPQLPPLYVVKCVDAALKKCVNNYVSGKLSSVNVSVAKKALLTYEECATIIRNAKRSTAAKRNDILPINCGMTLMLSQQGSMAAPEQQLPMETSVNVANLPYNIIPLKNGFLYLNIYRQIKLAYHEFEVAKTYEEDIKIVSSIPLTELLPFD